MLYEGKISLHFDPPSRHSRSTQSPLLWTVIRQSRVSAFRFSYFVHAPHLWNDLSHEIVNSLSPASFKTKLFKSMLLSQTRA